VGDGWVVAESERFELSRVLPPYGHSKTAP
jgi:hypothetical protein